VRPFIFALLFTAGTMERPLVLVAQRQLFFDEKAVDVSAFLRNNGDFYHQVSSERL
jgi:hypothetical protein